MCNMFYSFTALSIFISNYVALFNLLQISLHDDTYCIIARVPRTFSTLHCNSCTMETRLISGYLHCHLIKQILKYFFEIKVVNAIFIVKLVRSEILGLSNPLFRSYINNSAENLSLLRLVIEVQVRLKTEKHLSVASRCDMSNQEWVHVRIPEKFTYLSTALFICYICLYINVRTLKIHNFYTHNCAVVET